MTKYVHLTDPADFSGELTFGRAPEGALTFEDGEASVADDVDLDHLTTRYTRLEPGRADGADADAADAPATASATDDGGNDADATGDATADTEDADTDADSIDLADASYDELQDLAGEYDDVAGNLPKDELRAALRAKEE